MREGTQILVAIGMLIALVVAVGFLVENYRAPDYDPIAYLDAQMNEGRIGSYLRDREFQRLVENFEDYEPQVRWWALNGGTSHGRQIAFDAAGSAGLKGVRLLMQLSAEADAPERLEIVRQIGFQTHFYRDPGVREEVLEFLRRIEKENTVEGALAYTFLSTAHSRYSIEQPLADREAGFIERGLDPYANANRYPDFRPPKGSTWEGGKD